MSRTTYAPKQSYIGTGTLNVYTFDFKIESNTQLLIVVLDAAGLEVQRVKGDDVTYLSGVVFDSVLGGGTVTLLANLPASYKIILLLANDAPTQPYEFSNKTSFSLKRIENALDFIVGAVQRLAFRASQSIKLNDADNETVINTQLPGKLSDNLNKTIIVNATGDGLTFGDEQGGSSPTDLPAGGATGSALTKNSATDGDAGWDDFVITGFSSRFGVAWSSAGLRDTIEQILAITYLGPLIASFSGSSNSLREKGTSVSGITLTVSVTKRSNLIAQIVFKQSGVTFETLAPPAQTGTGSTASSIAVTPFSDNMTFSVEVTDAVVGLDGGNTVTSSTTYSFVYPYYYGAAAPGRTPAQVAALTKSIISSSANVNRSFTTSNGDVYYFAYPASYGNLTSILDENGFETFSAWTLTTQNITGLDASAQSYRIYESNNPVVAGSTDFTFIR